MPAVTYFISYSRKDAAIVLKLAKDLRAFHIDVWLDQLDIPVGEPWDDNIEQAMQYCKGMIIILSPESVASENVRDEIGFALGAKKRIIPVLIKPCSIPFRLQRLQYIDFTKRYEVGFEQLSQALNFSIKRPHTEQPAKSTAIKNYFLMGGIVLLVASIFFWLGRENLSFVKTQTLINTRQFDSVTVYKLAQTAISGEIRDYDLYTNLMDSLARNSQNPEQVQKYRHEASALLIANANKLLLLEDSTKACQSVKNALKIDPSIQSKVLADKRIVQCN